MVFNILNLLYVKNTFKISNEHLMMFPLLLLLRLLLLLLLLPAHTHTCVIYILAKCLRYNIISLIKKILTLIRRQYHEPFDV